MWSRRFRTGDRVVYRKSKHTTHPGHRAQQIRASQKGENYTYVVDKFWVVQKVDENGEVVVGTRRGKLHVISQSDPNLRHPSLWQRMRYRSRFAELQRLNTAG